MFDCTVDSRYLEFDGTMEKIRVNHSSTQRSYENTGSEVCLMTKGRQLERNFEELKPASHVPILGTILNIFDVFVAVFFSLLNSLNLAERLITYMCMNMFICFVYGFSAVALSLNFTHHEVSFFVLYCLFTINCVFLLFNKV